MAIPDLKNIHKHLLRQVIRHHEARYAHHAAHRDHFDAQANATSNHVKKDMYASIASKHAKHANFHDDAAWLAQHHGVTNTTALRKQYYK